MFMIGRFFATYAMNVGFQFTVEVLPVCSILHLQLVFMLQVMPTQLRGQGTALVNVMSMVAQMASPYIVYSVRL